MHGPVPLVRGGDRAVVRPEADEERRPAEGLPAEVADVDLAAHAHLGGCRVAQVGVVLPHDGLRAGAAEPEQRLQRLEHVPVAQVPGLGCRRST